MRKLELNTGELLEMRKQGMSNAEIAKSLDVSVPTITRRIGPSRRRGEKLEGISKLPPEEKAPQIMMINQQVAINGFTFDISHLDGHITILPSNTSGDRMSVSVKELDDLISALKAVVKICQTES